MVAYIESLLLYLFVLFFVPFAFKQADISRKMNKKMWYAFWKILSLVILSAIACFRGETGSDSSMYINCYNTQYFWNSYRMFEFGYILVNMFF